MPVFEIEKNGEIFEIEAPDERTAFQAVLPVQGPQQPAVSQAESAAAGLGHGMLWGYGPEIQGAGEYIASGGAPGSFERGRQEYESHRGPAQRSNPKTFGTANVAGGFLTPVPAVGRLVKPSIGYGLRFGGKAVQMGAVPAGVAATVKAAPLGPAALGVGWGVHQTVKRSGQKISKLGESLLKRPKAAAEKAIDPNAAASARISGLRGPLAEALKEAPRGPESKLSKEMLDALKRGKFRHDYSTGEWRDFLAPGE